MNRVNGFLFLDDYYLDKVEDSSYAPSHKWLTIDGERYYFKYTNSPYSEMIAYEIAKLLDIEAIEYDLAIYDGYAGVISKDYRQNDCKYIPGYMICLEYFMKNLDTMKQMGLEKVTICDEYNEPYTFESNNLENIWQALEFKYKDYPREEVLKVMYKIVEQFIFTLLTASPDKGSQNWDVIEKAHSLDLVPLYDNEGIYEFSNVSMGMSVGFEDNNFDVKKVIEKFLKISSSEYIEMFLDKYYKLKEFGMENILKIIEEKTEYEILFKDSYINEFNNHMKLIEGILNKLGIKNNIRR